MHRVVRNGHFRKRVPVLLFAGLLLDRGFLSCASTSLPWIVTRGVQESIANRLVAVTCITLREIHDIVLFFVCHRPRVAEYWNCRRPNPLGAREYSVTSRRSKYLGGSAQWAANPGATRIFGCPSCGSAFEFSAPLGRAARCYRGNH